MTKERARANEELRPVSSWENNQAKGHALCGQYMWGEHKDEVKTLRNRQAAYLNSLPSDPQDAISAAKKLLDFEYSAYPEGIEKALHFSFALEAMVKHSSTDDDGPEHDAAIYLADQVAHAMVRATEQLDRISDILDNPARLERESPSL